MLIFSFKVSMFSSLSDVDGLSLGTIALQRESEIVISSHQEMMIFPSIAQLLYGVENLVSNKLRRYDFYSVDSSFGLRFTRSKLDKIDIASEDAEVRDLNDNELVSAIWIGLGNFLSDYAIVLTTVPASSATEAIMLADFGNSMTRFQKVFGLTSGG